MGFLLKPVAGELPAAEAVTAPDSFAAYVDLLTASPGKWFKVADEISMGTAAYLRTKYPDFEFATRLMEGRLRVPGTVVKDKDLWARYGGTEYFLARQASLKARVPYGTGPRAQANAKKDAA